MMELSPGKQTFNPGLLDSRNWELRGRGRPRKMVQEQAPASTSTLLCVPSDAEFIGTLAIGRKRFPVRYRSVLAAAVATVIARMPEVDEIVGDLPTLWFEDEGKYTAFSADLLVKVSALTPGLRALDVTGQAFYITVLESISSRAMEDRLAICKARWRERMGAKPHIVLTRHDIEERCGDFFA